MKQKMAWRPVAVVTKFNDSGDVIETVRSEGNLLTQAGMDRIVALLFTSASGVAPLDDDSVRLGVGSSTEPADPADASLGDSQRYHVLDIGFPVIEGSTATYRATFGPDQGNFTWACWGIDVDDSGSVSSGNSPVELFNRKVFTNSAGSKDGGTWDLTVHIPIEG